MSPSLRAIVFLASFAFAVAILGTNVAANSLPFGSDIAGLLLRWISIRRGQVLCALLTFPIVPWKIIKSAKSLLTFLSGYSILMGPFAAIWIIDYFLVRNGNYYIPDLYIGNSRSRYWYTKGWNIRAVGAWIVGVALPFPGFVATFGTVSVNTGATRMWYLGHLLSLTVSSLVYYVSFLVFPDERINSSLGFEELAREQDIVLEGQEALEYRAKEKSIGLEKTKPLNLEV